MQPSTQRLVKNPWFWVVTVISSARFLTPGCFIGYYFTVRSGNLGWSIGWIVIAAALTAGDFFDGRLARKHAATSRFGDRLDHISDKLTLATGLIIWVALILNSPMGRSVSVVAIFALIAISLNIFLEGLLTVYNVTFRRDTEGANQIGRIKFVIQCFSLFIGAIGTTFYYSNIHILANVAIVAGIGFVVGAVLCIFSLVEYINKTTSTPS